MGDSCAKHWVTKIQTRVQNNYKIKDVNVPFYTIRAKHLENKFSLIDSGIMRGMFVLWSQIWLILE